MHFCGTVKHSNTSLAGAANVVETSMDLLLPELEAAFAGAVAAGAAAAALAEAASFVAVFWAAVWPACSLSSKIASTIICRTLACPCTRA